MHKAQTKHSIQFPKHKQDCFLQSREWEKMQKSLGVKTWWLEERNATALVLKRKLPLGRSWLYIPRGPMGQMSPELEKKLIEIGEQENSIFVRIDPPIQTPYSAPWRKAEREVQPRNTLILDLTKSEEELLADMHQKTRYNIRLAQKKGVQVRFSKDVADVEHFLKLSKDVSERTAFSYHPDEYYQAMAGLNFTELALAEYQGQVLAAHIIISFGDTVTYVHGASSSQQREVMAPHLLQWETLRRAKEKGYAKYDFFGVAPENADENHPWAGVTRFKLGIGGQRVDYIGAYDLVLNETMYHMFNAARRLKSFLR